MDYLVSFTDLNSVLSYLIYALLNSTKLTYILSLNQKSLYFFSTLLRYYKSGKKWLVIPKCLYRKSSPFKLLTPLDPRQKHSGMTTQRWIMDFDYLTRH